MLKRSSSRGVSLVEILVVLAILGVAAGAVARIATHQQRHYSRMAARSLALARLREGGEILTTELAGISPAAGDIYEGGMGPASIDFRSSLGTGILCTAPGMGEDDIDLVRLAPAGRASGAGDAASRNAWISAGDSIWLYDAAADTTDAVTVWHPHLVTAVAQGGRSCPLVPDSAEANVIRATLDPAVRVALEPHAPARTFRRARYALYRGADGDSYLGFSDCRPTVRTPACSPMQPVAGPYVTGAPPSPDDPPGPTFEYLDSRGTPTADRFAVAGIVVHLGTNAAPPGLRAEIQRVRRVIGLGNASK